MVIAHDGFIREAVLQQGYLASQVALFSIVNHPKSAVRADLVDLGKSDASVYVISTARLGPTEPLTQLAIRSAGCRQRRDLLAQEVRV